ncbi:MAG TPA: DUF2807 domain-containing protein, partial [Spirochaetia bacterium]
MAMLTETRTVQGFTEVVLRGYGSLDIVQNTGSTGSESLVIEADDELMPRIESEVTGRRLVLGLRMPWYEWMSFWLTWIFLVDKGIHYTLRVNRLTGISIVGSGRVRCDGLRGDACRLRIGGSGRLEASGIAASEMEAEVWGSGAVECAGRVESLRVRVSGSGRVKTENLAARRASVRIGG